MNEINVNEISRKVIAPIVTLISAVILFFVAKALVTSACYTVGPNEAVIITEFGEIKGKPVTTPGLHWKMPFVSTVNRLDMRIHKWDGDAISMSTGDKRFMLVDTFGRWQITDPVLYFTRIRDERTALSRMEDIVGSDVRNTVGEHPLIELVRTDKNRKPATDLNSEETGPDNGPKPVSVLPSINFGRTAIENNVLKTSTPKLAEVGIGLIDVRILRINYTPSVMAQIQARMISERRQIADRYRAEGEGKAAEILGSREQDLRQITSEAYKQAQAIRGEADAKATEIYAQAFNRSGEASELYSFLRTLETYRKSVTNSTTLILTTDSELFRAFKTTQPLKTAAQ